MEANSKPVNGFKRGNYYLFTFVTYYLYFLLRKREEGGVAEVSFKTNTKNKFEPNNQDFIEVSKLMGERDFKSLSRSTIYSPMSRSSLILLVSKCDT